MSATGKSRTTYRAKHGLPFFDPEPARHDAGDELCPRCGYWVEELNERVGWCEPCRQERERYANYKYRETKNPYQYDTCTCGEKKKKTSDRCIKCHRGGWHSGVREAA